MSFIYIGKKYLKYLDLLQVFSKKSLPHNLEAIFDGYLWLTKSPFSKEFLNSQPAFTCSKLTTETLKQGVKYVQS